MTCVLRALLVLAALLPGIAPDAVASGIDRLTRFIEQTHTAAGRFEQVIHDRQGRLVQRSQGTLAFARPGKFRWVYETPYEQVIVGDGERVWIYDRDLNQVTVRKLDRALGSTPAALLAGDNAALKAFALKDLGTRDGLEWVEATPRDKDSTFGSIRMGFGETRLERMDLTDSFGQTTLLRFLSLDRNPAIAPELFQFTPPAGADVIGEAK